MNFYKIEKLRLVSAYDPGGFRNRSDDWSPTPAPRAPSPTPEEERQKRDRTDEIRSGIDDILAGRVEGVEVFVDEFGMTRARRIMLPDGKSTGGDKSGF